MIMFILKKYKRIFFFTAIIGYGFSLTSCSDNSLNFDERNKIVEANNAKSINKLRIIENDSLEFYLLKKENINKVRSFKLTNINEFYDIYNGYLGDRIDSFTFRNNSTYLIMNVTNGDAASGDIKISIDSKSNTSLAP